jgi:membrane protease YdiL (CAAX protease family)
LLSRLLPRQRRLSVPWSAGEVFVAFVLVNVLWPAAMHYALAQRASLPSGLAPMVSVAASVPFGIVSVLLVMHAASETQLYQLGLHGHRLGRNMLLGVLAWLVVTPLAYLVHAAMVSLFGRGDEHPLQQTIRENPTAAAVALVVLVAVVAAPLSEEFLFRGVLQPWLTRHRWGPVAVTLIAFGLAFLSGWSRGYLDLGSGGEWYRDAPGKEAEILGELQRRGEDVLLLEESGAKEWRVRISPRHELRELNDWLGKRVRAAGKPGILEDELATLRLARLQQLDRNLVADLAPALFVLIVAPCVFVGPYLVRWWLPNRAAAAAVFGSSVLFAAMHSAVWPSPIPLFFFGLVQGWLSYRTQSLVPSLVVHALFNAVACTTVLFP